MCIDGHIIPKNSLHVHIFANKTRKSFQDPAGNRTTRRPPDHCKETQTAAVRSCLPFIKSGLQGTVKGGRGQGRPPPPPKKKKEKKKRERKKEVGRQHQGMDRPRVRKVPDGSGEQRKIVETGFEIIFGVPTTLVVEE